jgi:hypothetical protein
MVGDDMAWMRWSKSNESKFASIWKREFFLHDGCTMMMIWEDAFLSLLSIVFSFYIFTLLHVRRLGMSYIIVLFVFFERYSLD